MRGMRGANYKYTITLNYLLDYKKYLNSYLQISFILHFKYMDFFLALNENNKIFIKLNIFLMLIIY